MSDHTKHINDAIDNLNAVEKETSGHAVSGTFRVEVAKAQALIAIAILLERLEAAEGRGGRGPFGTIRS